VEQRNLGRTGLTVSALGFGCGAVGGLFVKGDAAAQRQALDEAVAAGISYFDTAPSYGDGASETNLGQVLAESGASVRVGTKVRVLPGDVADAAGVIRRSLETSLRRLRRERVDLLQLHTRIGLRRDEDNGQLSLADALGPVLDGFRQVQSAGLTGHIGFTGLGETEALQQVLGAGAFESMQSYFNAVNPSAGWPGRAPGGEQDFAGVIGKAAAAGVGIIVIRPLAAGALGAVETRHPNAGGPGAGIVPGADYASHLRQAQHLAQVAAALGLDGPVELALRFVLSQPGVSTVLVGFSDRSQLSDALRWTERGALAPEAIEQILVAGAGLSDDLG